jgi:hypothetical protein
MSDKYILKGKTPVKEDDLFAWAEWFESADRHVAKTALGEDVLVSTIFLGLDHNFLGKGGPILFETMIFGGAHDQDGERWHTWEEAEAGHQHYVKIAKKGMA